MPWPLPGELLPGPWLPLPPWHSFVTFFVDQVALKWLFIRRCKVERELRAYPRSVLLLAQVEHRNRALQSAPTRAGPLKNTQTVSVTRSQSGVG